MASPQGDSVLKAARDQTSTPSDNIGAEAKPPSKTAKIYKKPKQKPPMEPPIPTIAIFYGFLLVNTLAAAFAPIQDCDEVFNYWEPTHYLNHGSGLQTWEYSPEFSIRSWLYIVIHAIIGKFGSLLSSRSTAEFYAIRMALGAICALCETRLFSTICKTFNPRVGILFGIVMVFSPGMFHASVAYLPSSFSMYTTMLGMAAFMDWRGGLKTGLGMMWFGIGALVGWPFSGALIIPLLAEDAVLSSMTGDVSEIVFRYLDGVVRSLIVLALQVAVDAFFYHTVTVVPWNIIYYNVFSGPSRGANIFGTEPWDFYLRNLSLNFNIWFLLALLAGPILGLQFLLQGRSATRASSIRSMVFSSPFYLWLAVFSAQAHKEERFMYPAYPFLALNASLALHTVLAYVGSSDPARLVGKIPARLKLYVVGLCVILAIDIGVARTVGMISAYGAPLQVYTPLQTQEFAHTEANVCLGKDWYRFPSSYFLPSGMRVKFVKSAFDGLLPGQFTEAKTGFGFFPGTWLIPPGMNDQNIEDPSKHFHLTTAIESGAITTMSSLALGTLAGMLEDWQQFLAEHSRIILYSILGISFLIGAISRVFAPGKQRQPRRANSPDLEKPAAKRNGSNFKAPERKPGVWTPIDFRRPDAAPYPDWDVHTTKPLPYRPFKHGPYHITMGLRTMQWDEWIELDNHFLKFHDLKARRIEERGDKCCRTAPEAFDGAVELLEEL
ncbi:MAG: hypothetical protein Q9194_006993 [Teloschistes cf. exilis]